ncbi:MAG TPA: diguanylate cyclase, partial [Noviherbaspirillum sp.]|nr:diguanylate cyclase [Noviherbaspirillum sp.]
MTPPADASERHPRLRHALASFARPLRSPAFGWLVGALLILGVGWLVLLQHLAADRRTAEDAALRSASILAEAYASHLQQSLEAVDQVALYLKFAWEYSGGTFRLENIEAANVLPPGSDFVAAIVDRNGRIISSTVPLAGKPLDARHEPFFRAHLGVPVDFFYIGPMRPGTLNGKTVVQFSRQLIDKNGVFAGVVLISTPPEYFIANYDEVTLGQHGLLAILGGAGTVRMIRVGDRISGPAGGTLLAAPPLEGSKGRSFLEGSRWFLDGRSRYAAWNDTRAYDMVALAAIDQETALLPHMQRRASLITGAIAASSALLLAALVATLFSAQLANRQQQLEALRRSYRAATEGGGDGYYIARPLFDATGKVSDFETVDCNARGAQFFEMRREELLGKRASGLTDAGERRRVLANLTTAYESGIFEGEQPWRIGTHVRWVHLRAIRSNDTVAITARDITATKEYLGELERRGNEDALTGLPNRHWVKDYLPAAMERTDRERRRLAVLFIDLDGFKAVNDTMGHDAGDEVLRNAGLRLRDAVRPHDKVVRIGGDEFIVVLEDVGAASDAAHVAERIVHAFQEPFRLSKGTHSIGTSIGIAVYPEDGPDADTLLKHADIAMYSAKTSGKQRYHFFDEEFSIALRIRHENEAELRAALERNELVVHYQPRIDLHTGRSSSLEALVRWQHPQRGLIHPADFIPIAEDSGLIVPLGQQVIDKVCAQLALWGRQGKELVPVSINVSARQFQEIDVAAALAEALQRYGVAPSLIELE